MSNVYVIYPPFFPFKFGFRPKNASLIRYSNMRCCDGEIRFYHTHEIPGTFHGCKMVQLSPVGRRYTAFAVQFPVDAVGVDRMDMDESVQTPNPAARMLMVELGIMEPSDNNVVRGAVLIAGANEKQGRANGIYTRTGKDPALLRWEQVDELSAAARLMRWWRHASHFTISLQPQHVYAISWLAASGGSEALGEWQGSREDMAHEGA